MLYRAFFLSILAGLSIGLAGLAYADAYNDGVAAYQAHNYGRAAQQFQNALRQQTDNPNALFYLGMAYSHLNRYDDARQAFETVIQTVPSNDPLATKSRNNINWLTKQQITLASNSQKAAQVLTTSLSRSSKDNYLTYVIPSGKIIHFDPRRMPLKVYISDGLSVQGWNNAMKQAVVYAMQMWQSGSQGRVRFTQVYNQDNADIIVRWQRNFSDNLLGVSPFQMAGDTIVRSDINLAVYYPDSRAPIPMEELKGIAVHEMGHAIGLKGHSPYTDDIMFFSKVRSGSALSMRDRNTIAMLYNLDADVQNTGASTAMIKKYYDYYELGYQAQTSNRPADAIAYYRKALSINGSLMEAKFNLGALLINESNKMIRQNNLAGAKQNLEEAVRLYNEVTQNPKAPPASKDNLEVARNNLALINQALQH